jgi:hypothetical protein
MQSTFKMLAKNRELHLAYLEKYSLEQLNKTPEGFSNNLIWNLGHIVAVQQRLTYSISGLKMNISDEFFEKYKPGSKPTGDTTQEEADEIKHLLVAHQAITQADFAANKFLNFKGLTTGTGFHLGTIEEALEFINYHEGMHLGFMINIRKFV